MFNAGDLAVIDDITAVALVPAGHGRRCIASTQSAPAPDFHRRRKIATRAVAARLNRWNMRRRLPGARLILAILLTSTFGTNAHACICGGGLDGVLGEAEIAVLATVRFTNDVTRDHEHGPIEERDALVDVIEGFRGAANGEQLVLTTQVNTCQAFFRVGDTFLFFASRRDGDGRLETAMCAMKNFHSQRQSLLHMNATFKVRLEETLQILRSAR